MNRVKPVLATCAIVTILGASAIGRAALSGVSDAHVGFQASGPAGLKIEGTTTELNVADDGKTITVTVPLANLSTGISLRDHHMKEKYLEVPKYPSAILTVARAGLNLAPAGKTEGDAPGSVMLHGQTRPVTVHFVATSDAGGVAAKGQFRINMNDFGIVVPSYLGVTVKPDVDVSANFRVGAN